MRADRASVVVIPSFAWRSTSGLLYVRKRIIRLRTAARSSPRMAVSPPPPPRRPSPGHLRPRPAASPTCQRAPPEHLRPARPAASPPNGLYPSPYLQCSRRAYGAARVTGKDGARVRAGRAASSVGNANPVVFKGPFTAPVVPSCTVEPHPTCLGSRQSTYVPARPAAPPPHLPTCQRSPPDHLLACAVAEPPRRQSRPHGLFSVSIPRALAQ